MNPQDELLDRATRAEEQAHSAKRIAAYSDPSDALLGQARGYLEGSARAAVEGMNIVDRMRAMPSGPSDPDPIEPPPSSRKTPEVLIPDYSEPSEFDWVIESGRARRLSDGFVLPSRGNLIPKIFDHHPAGIPLRVKLNDDYFDKLQVGWGYNLDEPSLVARPTRGGFAPVHLNVVGPDKGRAIMGPLLLSDQFSPIDKLVFHRMAHTGPEHSDARGAVTGFNHIPGRVGLIDFEIRQHPGVLRLEHGIYIGGGCDELYLKDRADVPDPMNGGHRTRFYHHFSYRKSIHRSYVIGCGLAGGGRTGDQHRPQFKPWGGGGTPATQRPSGNAFLLYNKSHSAGWDSPWAQGGQRLTEWCRPDGFLLVKGNVITDERYGCFGATVQIPEHGNHLTETGHTTRDIYLTENRFENKRGDRPTVMISSTMFARIDETNEIEPPADGRGIWLDSDWAKAQPDFKPSLEFEIAEKFKPITYLDGKLVTETNDPRVKWI